MRAAPVKPGDVVNFLTVKERGPANRWHQARWWCECRCGKRVLVRQTRLAARSAISCSCASGWTARRERSRKWSGCGLISGTFWYGVLYSARRRKLSVTVSIEEAWQLFECQGGRCALSGLPLRFASSAVGHSHGQSTASLDRIDSTRGYEPGNVQWLHKELNELKWDKTDAELIELCGVVTRYQEGRTA